MNNNVIAAGVVGIIVIVIGFFIIGAMNNDDVVVVPVTSTPSTSSTSAQIEAQLAKDAALRAKEQEEKQVAFTIDVSKLPEAQQAALKVMGISSTSSISITNKMVSCAGVDMSATRMAEIKSGASVTAVEGVKLISCYNAN